MGRVCGKRCKFCILFFDMERLKNLTEVNRHMAKDEMEMITEDKWDEDIWGIEDGDSSFNGKAKVPKLVFYFGRNVSLKPKIVELLL